MRSILAGLIGIVALLFSSVAVFAQDEEVLRARKLINSWEEWVKRHDVSEAAIAVLYNGKTIAEFGFNRVVTDPAPVASISKSITGICIGKLVELGKVSFEDTLQDYVPALASTVTVGSLLKHTSGYTRDVTQRPDRYIGRDHEYLRWVSKKEISKGIDHGEIGKFNYNNSNYAMLGTIISAVTNKTYEQACKDLVFEPIGITNVFLNPKWRIMSAWGGWMISAQDHLKFLHAYFGRNGILEESPFDLPTHSFGNGMHYGMGYMFRNGRNNGINFWHDGRWHTKVDGVLEQFGAFFVSFDNGWVVTTSHNISAIKGEHGELDRLIAEATHSPI